MLIVTVAVFILILSILVLIHELGHFTAAKKLGIRVEEFGFGLPPKLWGKKIGETIYSINWLPIGGFVRLYGEEGEENKKPVDKSKRVETESKRAFYSRPIWQRVVVLTAGVSMNFLLGICIISYLFTQGVMVPTKRVHIEKISANSPASQAGLQNGDVVRSILVNDESPNPVEYEIDNSTKLSNTTKKYLGKEITLVIERGQEQKSISIIPREISPEGEGPMGVVISNYEEKKYSLWQAPFYGTKEAMVLTVELVKGIGLTLWKLISFQPVAKDVAGPIGIAKLTGEAVKFGNMAVLELLGILSLNLAIVNILPFPALDGGRLLFVFIEAVTGKRVKSHWERYVHQAGMVILLSLLVLVTMNDLYRIFVH